MAGVNCWLNVNSNFQPTQFPSEEEEERRSKRVAGDALSWERLKILKGDFLASVEFPA